MGKNIKITEEQYNMIKEEIDSDFISFTNDVKPNDGQLNITASGKMDDETIGQPVTTDKVQRSLTPQGYGRYRSYGNISPRVMREGVSIDQSDDFYDVKGFGNNDELNHLTNNDKNDDIVKIPQSVEYKINQLINTIKQENLSPKQQAIILNKFVEQLNYDNISYQWKKELINDLK